jgi:hypothetical protein
MDIVKLDPLNKEKAAYVVSAAFFDYPEFKHYFPDDPQRMRCLPWYLGRVLDTALRTHPDFAVGIYLERLFTHAFCGRNKKFHPVSGRRGFYR